MALIVFFLNLLGIYIFFVNPGNTWEMTITVTKLNFVIFFSVRKTPSVFPSQASGKTLNV